MRQPLVSAGGPFASGRSQARVYVGIGAGVEGSSGTDTLTRATIGVGAVARTGAAEQVPRQSQP